VKEYLVKDKLEAGSLLRLLPLLDRGRGGPVPEKKGNVKGALQLLINRYG